MISSWHRSLFMESIGAVALSNGKTKVEKAQMFQEAIQ